MKATIRDTLRTAVVVLAMGQAAIVQAADPFAARSSASAGLKAGGDTTFGGSSWTLPVDDPTYCFGENDLGQCVLYFGSRNACDSVTPCNDSSAPSRRELTTKIGRTVLDTDLTFCWGMDDDTRQCTLYLGTKRQCDHVAPCFATLKDLD